MVSHYRSDPQVAVMYQQTQQCANKCSLRKMFYDGGWKHIQHVCLLTRKKTQRPASNTLSPLIQLYNTVCGIQYQQATKCQQSSVYNTALYVSLAD